MTITTYTTYYSISGFSINYRDTDDHSDDYPVSFDPSVELFVAGNLGSGFSYYVPPFDDYAEVTVSDNTSYLSLDGYDLRSLNIDAYPLTIEWRMGGVAHSSTVLELDWGKGDDKDGYYHGTRYYFVLDGDPLPEFGSVAEFDTFANTNAYITDAYIPTGAYGEDVLIQWADLLSTTVLGADEDFEGTPRRDVFNGGYGDDTFFSSKGRDVYRGGVGDWDSVSYSDDPAGVTINLAKGFAIDGWGDRDALFGIEVARGSMFDDTMIGGNRTQTFRGLAGDDLINGGKGPDEARYDRDAKFGGEAGVIVNLQKRFAIDGFGDRDTLKSIENVKGSEQGDRIIGSNAANTLRGEGGNDSLLGLGGNDTLVGGNGRDRLDGGAGNDMLTGGGAADRFIFSGDFGDDIITDFQTAGTRERIDLSGVASIRNLADLRANHLAADGPNTVIDDHLGNTITLWGVSMDDLVKNDFLF